MSDKLKTIKVEHPENASDFMIINEADFDAKKHKKYAEAEKKSSKKAEAEADAQ